ncbi:BtrH N-terminal domain-containing protein [Actinoplanes sp. NPDC023936]|uniref:BtrH N-terminal domain-containing protein n=1 Tax=Actinoplanes sp. NPDC023936 TaxID=3154910 RepID=UPI0033CFD858
MTTAAPARWDTVLGTVDGAVLDCVSGPLAALLVHAGVQDPHPSLAEDWEAVPAAPDGGLPRFDLPPADLDERVAARTGLRPVWHRSGGPAEARDAWRRRDAVLVLGDAFALPWLPYFGHARMSHGFVVTGQDDTAVTIADPYDNVTEWGKAAPTVTTIAVPELDAAVTAADGSVRWAALEPAGAPRPVPAGERIAANARQIRAAIDGGVFDRFLTAHRELTAEQVDNLALQTWLLARSRRLHARWLADDRFTEDVVTAWDRAQQAAYLAVRRVRRGRPAPDAVLDRIRAAARAEYATAARLLEEDS